MTGLGVAAPVVDADESAARASVAAARLKAARSGTAIGNPVRIALSA